MRHETLLAGNPRMLMQLKNLARLGAAERAAIKAQAKAQTTGVTIQANAISPKVSPP